MTGTFRETVKKKCNSEEKPLGQWNPRDTKETYFTVLRETAKNLQILRNYQSRTF